MRYLLLSLLFLSGFAVSADEHYYWMIQTLPDHFSSPSEACSAWASKTGNPGQFTFTGGLKARDATSFWCEFRNNENGNTSAGYGPAARYGKTCPAETVYDTATGECKGKDDPCKDTFGKEIYTDFQVGTVKDGHFTDPKSPPASLCESSCLYTSPATTGSGNGYRMGQNFEVFVRYSYLGNGSSCEQGETPNPPSDRSPSGSTDENCKPVEDAEGRKKMSCLKTDSYQNPGNLNCGMANGQLVCVPGKPSPNKNDTTTKTDITETTNPDGSKDTTTTTETTVTTCSGMNSCNTTTTTSTTNNKTNSDGTDGGSSTECKGPGCKPSGEGAGGDSEGEEKEDEKESKVSGDESCDAVIACEGDAIQCAMLK
ncbi:hypothetical protein SL025_006434, partial [Pseudomonas aeruginosa]|nr:hypothetical protein [Pseudomonas aeruginosa]